MESIGLGRGVVEVCPSRLNISYTIGGPCQGVKPKENLKKLAGGRENNFGQGQWRPLTSSGLPRPSPRCLLHPTG